jgi:phosphoribosylformimino-5-aminoimidazole carboxamide ribotide isomerase
MTATSMAGFEVIPAIDLRDGRCVRLFQGDYAKETRYSEDPVATALEWQSLGAPRLHVVDLDGARSGSPANHRVMAAIAAAVSIPIEVSGGLRSLEHVAAAVSYGATRIQIGSAAVRDPEMLASAIAEYGDAICVSIDAREGRVATDGWERGTDIDAIEFAHRMADVGVARVMVTDISRDSTLTGPNVELLARLVDELSIPVVASGGVATVNDVVKLARAGCEGAIVGKALYEKAFTLPDALAAVEGLAC